TTKHLGGQKASSENKMQKKKTGRVNTTNKSWNLLLGKADNVGRYIICQIRLKNPIKRIVDLKNILHDICGFGGSGIASIVKESENSMLAFLKEDEVEKYLSTKEHEEYILITPWDIKTARGNLPLLISLARQGIDNKKAGNGTKSRAKMLYDLITKENWLEVERQFFFNQYQNGPIEAPKCDDY
ncbi:MAG: hypothetical protein ACRCYP_08255, partial [Alphaproteobacteria bacterium]